MTRLRFFLFRLGLILFSFIPVFLVTLILPAAASATTSDSAQAPVLELKRVAQDIRAADSREDGFARPYMDDASTQVNTPAESGDSTEQFSHLPTTTLEVAILSSPWAPLDHNSPDDSSDLVPRVSLVEAVVTNTGSVAAEDVLLNLDYPTNSEWSLLGGENINREISALAPGEAFHGYWFAKHSSAIGATERYTVTASAHNASSVSTDDNFYGNPIGDQTVQTRAFISTGNSGATQISADVLVGVAFTVTVEYDLGSNPQFVQFSPVGNFDFDPSAYRLLSTRARLFNDALTQEQIVDDRIFFPSLPAFAENAEVKYTFIAVKLADTQLCPYGAVDFGTTDKYDNKYCSSAAGNAVEIAGSVSLSLTKEASSPVILQGERLAYTLQYTNHGTVDLSFTWIWDQVDASVGSIITSTITPAYDADESNLGQGLVAWDVGTIPAGSSQTFSFEVDVDGAGVDLPDQSSLVNHGFFGISEGGLPSSPAITETVATTVQAPTIAVSKTDGLTSVDTGSLTYTLQVVNSGSVDTAGLVITDVLPAEVQAGAVTPPADSQIGNTLVWNIGNLASGGGTQLITIPVTVESLTPNGTMLTNRMTTTHQNTAGYAFESKTDTDVTTVNAPVLGISKSPFSDPAFVAPGGTPFTYTLEYNNVGDRSASGAVITDVVPVSTTFQTCSPSPCSLEGGTTVSWSVGTIPENGTGTVSFTVQLIDALQTGDQVVNEDYGIRSDQTEFVAGDPLTVTISREAGIIQGTTFVDADGDGVKDGGEGILDNVTVTLFNSVNSRTTVTTTNASGEYQFRIEVPGPISVTAALPGGHFRTTPGTVITQASLGITGTVDFGYAPSGSPFGVVFGTVFEDIDHDGTQDVGGGEYGLPGVSMASTGAAASPLTTNALGQYTFRYDSGGSVNITETNPVNYVSTTPDLVARTVSTGSSNNSPVDFGDFPGIKISGQVFEDADVDGVKDVGEGGVSGAGVAAGADSFTTDSTGDYTLYVSLSDSSPVDITEADPAGYISTNAIPATGMSKVDANTLRIVSPLSGTVYTDADFGDALQASDVITVSGTVFEDLNANGQRDAGEGGLSGAVVSLSSGLNATTGSDGAFLLYGPAGTQITVTENNPGGYVSTNAIPGDDASKVDLDTLVVSPLPAGSTSAGNQFGDALASSVSVITGTVFDDANENGLQESGEGGQSGVQVSLAFEGGSIITETASGGLYQFAVVPGTSVSISSAGPGGAFYPTTPEALFITPPTAGVFPNNDFGYSDDQDVAVILGTVFDDLNGNGEHDIGEPGLTGAEVSIAGVGSQTTSGNGIITGTYSFAISKTRTYVLRETNPSGYRSTTSDKVNVNVDSLGQSYLVDFGDTNSPNTATVFGLVFDDLNGNGVQDPTEPGIAGVTINIQAGDTVIISATTKSFGQFAGGGTFGLEIGEEGVHTVREFNLPGWRSTTPDAVNVNLKLGQSFNVDFGDTMATTFSSIMGTVFEDIDGDGVYDLPSERGISNVPINLSNGDATTSNAYGTYTFPVSNTGILEVAETDPPGYHSTTPNMVIVDIDALGQNYLVNFGDSQNPNVTSIFGTVFEDQNVNGSRENTELGLSGVTVTITDTVLGFTPIYNTNQWGQYTFQVESLSTYTLTETDLPGYVSTIAIPGDPAVTRLDNNNLRAVVNTLGTSLGGNLFGDVQASQVITVSGQVWNDNGAGSGTPNDGVQNGSEAGLAGATVSLSSGLSQLTDASGSFLLYAPPGETIDIVETNPSGYISSDAVPGNDASKVDADTIRVSPLSAGAASAGNLFGDLLPVDLTITKSDAPDPVAAGGVLTYTLDYSNEGPGEARNVVISDDLDADVVFGGVVSQPGSLSGPNQSGQTLSWTTDTLASSVSGTVVFTVTVKPSAIGSVSNNLEIASSTPESDPSDNQASVQTNVGVPGLATIYGIVFEDLNGNGVQDAGESGIPNVLITLDGSDTTTTDAAGEYYFLTADEGVHTVVESDPAGYFSTTPNEIHLGVALGDSFRVDFGDAPEGSGFASVFGTVFEDLSGDGAWDVSEVGIPNVTITLDEDQSATTNKYGSYTFVTTEEGSHTVGETDLPGYVSTTPNIVNVDVVLDRGHQVDFGDQSITPCDDDSFEEDDASAQAGTIQIGAAFSQNHNFCGDAVDWISFSAQAGNVYTITTSSWGQRADTFLSLYDPQGQTLLAANDDFEGSTDFSSRISWEAPADGTYLVRITNRAGLIHGDTDYDVWVEEEIHFRLFLPYVGRDSSQGSSATSNVVMAPSGVINHACPDVYEVDDTWQEAGAILPGATQTHSFDSNPAQYAADKDFVWFDLRARDIVTFTITQANNTQTLLELYDSNGDALDVTGSTQIVWEATESGRFYLSVSPVDTMNFGCADVVGYDLQYELKPINVLFLPAVTR